MKQAVDQHWEQHTDRLQRVLACSRFGLISDFDGTLSAFAPHPDVATIVPENARLLDGLAERVTVVALVSGRSVQDVRARFTRPQLVYYGNHGLEHWSADGPRLVETARAWRERLQTVLNAVRALELAGVIVEDKDVTGSIHYRLAADPEATKAQLQAHLLPLCTLTGLQLSAGQFIWDIKPPLRVDKGTAVRAIADDYQLESVIFFGDDVTDYAAMRALRALAADPTRDLQTLSVGVVHPTTPPDLFAVCDLTANGVADVTHCLRWILEHRTPPTARQSLGEN